MEFIERLYLFFYFNFFILDGAIINYRSESVYTLFRGFGKQYNKIADKNISLLTVSLKCVATPKDKAAVGRKANSEVVHANRHVPRTAWFKKGRDRGPFLRDLVGLTLTFLI